MISEDSTEEKLAKLFYTYYEQLAPKPPWAEEPVPWGAWNEATAYTKQQMVATASAVLEHLYREAEFADGCTVEVILPIPGWGEPLAQCGERGKLAKRSNDFFRVSFPGDKWIVYRGTELALYLKKVEAEEDV